MKMKTHILAAMQEIIADWDALLGGLGPEQVRAPLLPSRWTVKDVLAHLMGWQQRSVARAEAALRGREPQLPAWSANFNLNTEEGTDQANAWLYEHYRAETWEQVHTEWRKGFERLLEAARQIDEPALLDSSRFAWMNGYSIADVLLGWYDHHQEHLEWLQSWLRESGGVDDAA